MQRDSGSTARASSLTAQLQDAWLRSQIPKLSKAVPLSSRSPRSAGVSSSSSSKGSWSKPVKLDNVAKPWGSGGFGESLVISEVGCVWTPPSTRSLESSGSAPFSEWSSSSSHGVGLDDDLWDNMSPRESSLASNSNSGFVKEAAQEKKLARFDTDDTSIFASYVAGMLKDESLASKRCMVEESLAYQAGHNELADVIGAFGSLDKFGLAAREENDDSGGSCLKGKASLLPGSPVPLDDVEKWIESLLSAPAPPVETLADFQENSESSSLRQKEEMCGPAPQAPDRVLPGSQIPDLDILLLQCAQAVSSDDVLVANRIVGEIRHYSSPYGNGVQRLAHYFTEGLVARLSGSGADLYSASRSRPTATAMVRAYHMYETKCPYVCLAHRFSNQALLDAFEGASRVHVVDYGVMYGFQWPSFIKELADRPGGPPRLRLTGVDFPQPGFKPAERLEDVGKRLEDWAKLFGVPFEFQAVASKWEAVHPAALGLRHDEVLAVNCIYRLRHLLDESVMPSSPRKLVLNRIRSMNPKIFVTGIVSGCYNVPFFMSRFRECLHHYSYVFDSLDSIVPRDCDVRALLEREILGREILNVVACEGTERVERPEPYYQWHRRLKNAGFSQLPLSKSALSTSLETLRQHHKDFGVADDDGWLLLGWKNQVAKGLAAWQPAEA